MASLAKRSMLLTGTYVLGMLGQRAIQLLTLPLYTWFLTPAEFGVVALLTLITSLVTLCVSSPASSALARYCYHPDYRPQHREFLGSLLLFCGLKSLVLAGIYLMVAGPTCNLLFGDGTYIAAMRLYAMGVILSPSATLLMHYLQMTERARRHVLASWGMVLGSTSTTLYLLMTTELGVVAVAWGQLVGIAVNLVVASGPYLSAASFRLRLSVLKSPLRYGYVLLVGGYSQTIINAGDRFVLLGLSSVAAVGLYDFGYRIGGLMLMLVAQPTKNATLPMLLRMESDPERLRKTARTMAVYVYTASLAAALFLSLSAEELIQLMSSRDAFVAAWIIVPPVALAYSLHALGNLLNVGVMMADRPSLISMNLVISGVTNILLNLLLIPYWGILGAALATLLTYVLWNALKAYQSARLYDLHFDWRRIVHATLAAVGLGATGLAAAPHLSFGTAVAVKSAAWLSFPAILWTTGFFSLAEKAQLAAAWRRLRRTQSAASETTPTPRKAA